MKQKKYIRKSRGVKTGLKHRQGLRSFPSVMLSSNFSDVEDNVKAFEIIRNIALSAGTNAGLEAKAAGLSTAYVRQNQKLVKVSPEGKETVLAPKTKRASFYIKFEPQTVFHAVKK